MNCKKKVNFDLICSIFKPGLNRITMMKNLNQLSKHTGLWSIAPTCPVSATFEGSYLPSNIRGTDNDAQRMSRGFIEGVSYT